MSDLAGSELDEIRRLAAVAARAAADKKATDTLVLEVGGVLAITDFFVITSGSNARQVRTIAEDVEAQVARAAGRKPLRTEGLDDARWVLLDFGDFVVHVFLDEVRLLRHRAPMGRRPPPRVGGGLQPVGG